MQTGNLTLSFAYKPYQSWQEPKKLRFEVSIYQNEEYVNFGSTEAIEDDPNPKFQTKINVKFNNEDETLKIIAFDTDNGNEVEMGKAFLKVSRLTGGETEFDVVNDIAVATGVVIINVE